MPTLGEFIVHARKYGFRKRSLTLGLAPKSQDRIVYLWRSAEHFAELPVCGVLTRAVGRSA
jgi:hypothetical protein